MAGSVLQQQLVRLKNERGMSKKGLAEAARVNLHTTHSLLYANKESSLSNLERIANALGYTIGLVPINSTTQRTPQ